MRGAVAAGSPLTMEAGLHALRIGGNAVDAAIASTLMAGVAEPLLTGLGGAGMATVRMNGEVFVCDMFANIPGLEEPDARALPMDTVTIDFGPTTQRFFIGLAAAAIPGLPAGLCALHTRHGQVSLTDLAAPAIRAANEGVEVLPGFERVCELLWPILAGSPEVVGRFGREGRPLRSGETFWAPELATTLEAFAKQGSDYFSTGAGAVAMQSALLGRSRITATDLRNQAAIFREPLHFRYRDADIWVPGPPSLAGMVVLHILDSLATDTMPIAAYGAETAQRVLAAMHQIDGFRTPVFYERLFTAGFASDFIEHGKHSITDPSKGPGLTTHISTVDAEGNAVAITHSLGETCGQMVPGTGVLINNFLGEEDVNPSALSRVPGSRLVTMCCPTIVQHRGTVYALGSGGSSRIPTAIMHGTMFLVDHGLDVPMAVAGPRVHIDQGIIHIESDHRSAMTMATLDQQYPNHVRFDGPNMFFGGLHIAGQGESGFVGSGDARRSGAFGVAN